MKNLKNIKLFENFIEGPKVIETYIITFEDGVHYKANELKDY
jgi:hypothetical protein